MFGSHPADKTFSLHLDSQYPTAVTPCTVTHYKDLNYTNFLPLIAALLSHYEVDHIKPV